MGPRIRRICSTFVQGRTDAHEPVHRRADHRDRQGVRGGGEAGRTVPKARCLAGDLFYKWRAKYGGMAVSDAKRLRALEEENRRLKQLLADTMLDNQALKGLLAKNC